MFIATTLKWTVHFLRMCYITLIDFCIANGSHKWGPMDVYIYIYKSLFENQLSEIYFFNQTSLILSNIL